MLPKSISPTPWFTHTVINFTPIHVNIASSTPPLMEHLHSFSNPWGPVDRRQEIWPGLPLGDVITNSWSRCQLGHCQLSRPERMYVRWRHTIQNESPSVHNAYVQAPVWIWTGLSGLHTRGERGRFSERLRWCKPTATIWCMDGPQTS